MSPPVMALLEEFAKREREIGTLQALWLQQQQALWRAYTAKAA